MRQSWYCAQRHTKKDSSPVSRRQWSDAELVEENRKLLMEEMLGLNRRGNALVAA